MSKRILLPTPYFTPQRGGVARYLSALKQVLGENIVIKYWPTNFPRGKKLVKKIQTLAVDYDEIWTSHIYPIGNALRKIRKPYLVMLHGMDFDLARRNIARAYFARKILKKAKVVTVNSQALANEVKKFCGVDSLVVYPVVSDALIKTSHIPNRLNRKTVKLLTVGRLVERKGHLKILEVLKNLRDVKYLIVGDGEMKTEILKKIAEYKLEDQVELRTEVADEDLPEIYKEADIFVMPTSKTNTDREGFGIVYLEAGLFGLPSIAVNHPGVDEAVLDNETGILINDSQEELKSAIIRLVENQSLCLKMGLAGRDRTLAEFTAEAQFQKLQKLI